MVLENYDKKLEEIEEDVNIGELRLMYASNIGFSG